MEKVRYMFPLFFGIIGMVFYLTMDTLGFGDFWIELLIIIISSMLIGYGSKLITRNHDKEKGKNIRLVVGSFAGLTILMGGIIALFYDPFVGIGITALLAVLFLTAVRLIYRE